MNATTICLPVNELMNTEQTAQYLNVQPQTLAVWRCNKRYSIPFLKAPATHAASNCRTSRDTVEREESLFIRRRAFQVPPLREVMFRLTEMQGRLFFAYSDQTDGHKAPTSVGHARKPNCSRWPE